MSASTGQDVLPSEVRIFDSLDDMTAALHCYSFHKPSVLKAGYDGTMTDHYEQRTWRPLFQSLTEQDGLNLQQTTFEVPYDSYHPMNVCDGDMSMFGFSSFDARGEFANPVDPDSDPHDPLAGCLPSVPDDMALDVFGTQAVAENKDHERKRAVYGSTNVSGPITILGQPTDPVEPPAAFEVCLSSSLTAITKTPTNTDLIGNTITITSAQAPSYWLDSHHNTLGNADGERKRMIRLPLMMTDYASATESDGLRAGGDRSEQDAHWDFAATFCPAGGELVL